MEVREVIATLSLPKEQYKVGKRIGRKSATYVHG